jgi:hypothetical protein
MSQFFLLEQLDDEHPMNGAESPSVELVDRTGELFDNENVNWQSSAVYDHQAIVENGEEGKMIINNHEDNTVDDNVWSVVDDLTRKTQELLLDEPKVSSIND